MPVTLTFNPEPDADMKFLIEAIFKIQEDDSRVIRIVRKLVKPRGNFSVHTSEDSILIELLTRNNCLTSELLAQGKKRMDDFREKHPKQAFRYFFDSNDGDHVVIAYLGEKLSVAYANILAAKAIDHFRKIKIGQ